MEAPVSEVWLTIVLVAVASAAIKAAGPLLLGDRQLGPRATVVIASLGPALLTALVLVDTITAGRRLVVDARLAGVAAAGIALLLRAPMLLVLAVAIATTGAGALAGRLEPAGRFSLRSCQDFPASARGPIAQHHPASP